MKEKKYVVPANEYSKTDQAWCALRQANIAGEAMWEEHAEGAVNAIFEQLDDYALRALADHGGMILGNALVRGMFERSDWIANALFIHSNINEIRYSRQALGDVI